MKKLLLLLLFCLSLFSYDLELQNGFVAAHTQMLMDSTIDPMTTHLQAQVHMEDTEFTSIRGKLWVELEFFSSDNHDRDEHMYEVEEIEKFPLASYEITSVTKDKDNIHYNLHGTLSFHGSQQPLIMRAQITQENRQITISATSQINVTDFNMQMPCMLFMCVRDEVDIFAKAVFLKP